jgi:hypothetical protein
MYAPRGEEKAEVGEGGYQGKEPEEKYDQDLKIITQDSERALLIKNK